MDEIVKMQKFLEKHIELLKPILEKEKYPELDFMEKIHYLFFHRFYYNIQALTKIFELYREDGYMIFPIGLLVRTSLLDYMVYLFFIEKLNDVTISDKELEIKKYLVDAIHRYHLDIDEKLKRREINELQYRQASADVRRLYPEYFKNSEPIKGSQTSPRKIIDYLKTRNAKLYEESLKAYNAYTMLSKYEHVGAFTYDIYRSHLRDAKFDIGGIVNCLLQLHFAIHLIFRHISSDEKLDKELGDSINILAEKFDVTTDTV